MRSGGSKATGAQSIPPGPKQVDQQFAFENDSVVRMGEPGGHPGLRIVPFNKPEWMPPAAAAEARAICVRRPEEWQLPWHYPIVQSPEMRALLYRLVTDKRMQKVWRELLRPSALPGGAFLHEARGKTQDDAAAEFFRRAFTWFLSEPLLIRRELRQRIAERKRIVASLRHLAVALIRVHGVPRHTHDIEDVAERIESWAATHLEQDADGPLVVERQRTDKDLRAFAVRMSGVCTTLFGASLSGTVATLASVAFQRDVRLQQVKDLVKGSKRLR